jgi:lipoprotein-releasing system ATP-binding protein
MLQLIDIHMEYPTPTEPLVVLAGVSLELSAGDSATIMGPSGSGKSTLLNVVGTLEPPTSGTVSIDGADPYALGERELASFRNRRIGFVFQEHHLLPQCSALENVLLPTLAGRFNDDAESRAEALLDRVGLSDRLGHRPAELSGGQRQRVAIARALINAPAVVLADEPTGDLDRAAARQVADLLMELHREQRTILIIVTHDESLAKRTAKRFDLEGATLVAR